jgi:hypothetical protein
VVVQRAPAAVPAVRTPAVADSTRDRMRGEGGGLAASEQQRQPFRGCFRVEVVGPTMRTGGKLKERNGIPILALPVLPTMFCLHFSFLVVEIFCRRISFYCRYCLAPLIFALFLLRVS